MKKNYLFIIICMLLIACSQNNVSNTTFRDESIFDTYSLKIPTNLNKEEDGYYSTPSYNDNEIFQLSISVEPKGDRELDEILNQLVHADKREVVQNKSLVKKENLQFNNFTGIFAEYDKNNNKGIIPVMSHFSFSVLQDGPDIVKVSALSFGKNYMQDVLTTVKSIKRLSNTANINSETNEQTEKVPEINISNAKKEGYQVFESDNFMVKCNCNFRVNSLFIKMAKEQGNNYPISAYVCSENENSYETGAIYNINIYDLSVEYEKLATSRYKLFEESYLESYKNNLKSSGINYTTGKYLGVNSVEYSFNQMDLPTKAIIFVKNKKSYLLQIGTRKNLNEKYNDFKKSFNILKQE